jgi:tetratricopeptide (TPR) repeat protein
LKFFLPDPYAKRDPRRKLWWALVVTGIFVLLLAGQTVWEKACGLHARKLAAEGEALAAQLRWPEALNKAKRALKETPGSARALRLTARALGAEHRIEAVSYWEQVCRTPEASVADREEFLQILLPLGKLDLAEKQINSLLKKNEITLQTARLAASFYERRGDKIRTVQFAREVLLREPNDEQMQFVLGRMLLSSTSSEEALVGRVLLNQLVVNHSLIAIEAIRLLAASDGLNAGDAEICKLELSKSPWRNAADEFVIADLEILITPYKKNKIIAEVAARPRKSLEEKLLLGRWLSRRKEYGTILRELPIGTASLNRDLLLLHLDALAGLGEWRELEKVLAKKDINLEPILTALYQARVAKELKQSRIAQLRWEQVQDLAERNPAWLSYVGDYAARTGEIERAMAAYRISSRQAGGEARRAFEKMLALLEQQGDTKALRNLVKEICSAYPEDLAARNDLAYLNLLLIEDVSTSAESAVELVKEQPLFLSYRTTLALGYLRMQKNAEALALYKSGKIDWGKAQSSWRAIYATVLARNGERSKAEEIAKTINLGSLKKEEQLLLADRERKQVNEQALNTAK